MKRVIIGIAGLIGALSIVGTASVDERLWAADLVHYEAGTDKWVIRPAVEPTEPQSLADVLRRIHTTVDSPDINHIALGTLFKRTDLQFEVVRYLENHPQFRRTPPPFGKNRWDFESSGEIRKLVADALLSSVFVTSIRQQLQGYNWSISSVDIEKLYFTKEDGKIAWHGIVWLKLSKRAKEQ
jgi:hypothetical protein